MKFHTKTTLIIVIICNVAVIAGYYFLFQHIVAQTQKARELTSTIDLGQQKNSKLSALRVVVKDTELKREQLATYLLPSDSEIPFIEQVETLARNSGLEVKTNSVSSAAGSTDKIKTFQMQTATTGSWSNIMYFLSQIENMPYNIHVGSVSFGKQAAQAGKTTSSAWTATFDISVTEST